MQIESKISAEEKSIEGMTLERNDKTKKIIICVGKTGHGKSTFVNRLSGDMSLMARNGPCKTSIGYRSCTQSLQKVTNGKLCIIDCPGWADAGGADREHSNNLCAFLRGCGGINAFVLIRNATQYRFDADFQQKLRHLGDTFGDKFWGNLIIVLTHVDKGIHERRYHNSNKASELQKEIANLCNKNVEVPVIPFGLDNYKMAIGTFEYTIPEARFVCNKITSPIDTLKANKKRIVNKQEEIQAKIDKITNKINKIQRLIDVMNNSSSSSSHSTCNDDSDGDTSSEPDDESGSDGDGTGSEGDDLSMRLNNNSRKEISNKAWKCHICTFENISTATKCEICEQQHH